MRRPNQRNWSQLKVGLVIVLAVLGILFAIMNLNEGMGVFTLRSLFSAFLNDSQGLKVGAPVRMSGVDVGNVKRIEIDPDKGKVAVLFTVKNEIRVLLHTDAAVVVRPMGLLGDKYLEILPGNLRLPPLPDGAVLAAGRGETDITGVADTATATLMNVNQTLKDIQGILAGFKEGKGTAGKLVTDPELYDRTTQLIRKAEGVSEQTSQLLSKIERGEGTLGKLMTDRAFYDRATAAAAELQKLSAALNGSDGTLGRLARDPALYQRLENLTARGEALLGKIEHGEGTLGKLVNQDQLYQRTDKVLTEMEALLADVKKNPTKYFKFSVF
jgi:phospholipid/cholesterol/gamma-HCH transport system substrate-binding protein